MLQARSHGAPWNMVLTCTGTPDTANMHMMFRHIILTACACLQKCMPDMPSSVLQRGQGRVLWLCSSLGHCRLHGSILWPLACATINCRTSGASLPSWRSTVTTLVGCLAVACLPDTSGCTRWPWQNWRGRTKHTSTTSFQRDQRCSNPGTGLDDPPLPCSGCSPQSSRAQWSYHLGWNGFGVLRCPCQWCSSPQQTRLACRTTDRTRCHDLLTAFHSAPSAVPCTGAAPWLPSGWGCQRKSASHPPFCLPTTDLHAPQRMHLSMSPCPQSSCDQGPLVEVKFWCIEGDVMLRSRFLMEWRSGHRPTRWWISMGWTTHTPATPSAMPSPTNFFAVCAGSGWFCCVTQFIWTQHERWVRLLK